MKCSPEKKRFMSPRGAVPRIVLLLLAFSVVCDALSRDSYAEEASREVLMLKNYPVRIEYEKKDKKVAEYVFSICERNVPVISSQLGLDGISKIRVVLVPRMRKFTDRSGVSLPDWGAAFAFMEKQVMLVDVQKAVSTWDALEKTIPHELSHLLLAQKVGDVSMPTWFLEGLAQWQAHQWSLVESWHLMNAVWSKRVPALPVISGPFPGDASDARTAYRVSYLAFIKLFDGHPFPQSIPRLMNEITRRKDFAQAVMAFRGESLQQYSSRFGKELEQKYTTRLLIFQTGPLFSILAIVFLFVVLRVKLRTRRRLKKLEMIDRGLSLDD